jgi:single-strand DNA-binding protein
MSNVFNAVCTCTRDAEVRYLQSGGAVLNVNVANNQGFGDKQKTMFIRVALFGKRAEGQLKDYLVKGQQVFVSGELSVNEYQAQDGTTKTNLELNANIIDLVGKKSGTEQKQENHAQYSEQNSRKYQTQNVEEFDDIPF